MPELIDLPEDELVLTTVDNPYNPKTDYHKWYNWDIDNGYFTESYIARLLQMEEDYDEDDDVKSIEVVNRVINEILEQDDDEIYRLV
jgi:hypothetical protein